MQPPELTTLQTRPPSTMMRDGGSVIRGNPSAASNTATTSTPVQARESFSLSSIREASDLTPFNDSFIERLTGGDSAKDPYISDAINNRLKDT